MSFRSEERKVSAAFVFGWPADSPLMQDLNIKSGRRVQNHDRDMVMLGSGLAEALKVKVGDKIEIYGTEIPIAGIFDSADRFENLAVVMLLSDLQGFMNRPQEITGVLVRTDIPKDDKPEHKAQLADVRAKSRHSTK